jgi:hypothetical protein
MEHNLGPTEIVEGLLSDQLFEHLKIAQYLSPRCNTANTLNKSKAAGTIDFF